MTKKNEAQVEFEYTDDKEVDENKGEVETIETVLNNEDIDNLIEGLEQLKETKESIAFELNDEIELVFHHEEGLEENSDGDFD